MFDDDWQSSTHLYPRNGAAVDDDSRPPITLLVVAVADNVIFDPSREELAVAETALAISVSEVRRSSRDPAAGDMETDSKRQLRLLSMRTIDPPSRLTPPGVPHVSNVTSAAPASTTQTPGGQQSNEEGVWKAPVGGTKYAVLNGIMDIVLESGGVVDEILDGLEGVDLD